MLETGLAKQAMQESLNPFQELNEQYRKSNSYLSELISRLTAKLHHLSNTNVPQEENPCCIGNPTKFKEGRLMDYYHNNDQQNYLNRLLEEQVTKIESLI